MKKYFFDFFFVENCCSDFFLKKCFSEKFDFQKNIDILKIPLVSEKPLSTSLMYSRYKEENNAFFHEQGSYPHQLNIEGHGKIVASIGEIIGPVAFSSLCAEEKWIKSETGKIMTNKEEQTKHVLIYFLHL